MDVEVHCVKTGKNTTKCAAWDNDDPGGTYWQGTCTKHKDGTWSCVQTSKALRKIPRALRDAVLDAKGKKRPRSETTPSV